MTQREGDQEEAGMDERLTNWAGNVIFSARRIHRPTSLAALQRLVAGSERIRAFVVYSVAFGLAAGIAPMMSGALLDVVDARYGPTAAYGALFAIGLLLRLSAYPWLRQVPAPNAERGTYVSAVVLRAMRWRVRRKAA